VRPELADDLYTDAAIRDPFPLYRAIRDRAPAVWLSAHGVWALGRFGDVRSALRADAELISGRGVALNDFVNQQSAGTTLASDGKLHRVRRALVMKPMMPSALREIRGEIERLADALVAELLARDSFDGIADFARHLPVAVVADLVGLPGAGRERTQQSVSVGPRPTSGEFVRDLETKDLVFRWIDVESGEVVRQLPDEAVLRVRAMIEAWTGTPQGRTAVYDITA